MGEHILGLLIQHGGETVLECEGVVGRNNQTESHVQSEGQWRGVGAGTATTAAQYNEEIKPVSGCGNKNREKGFVTVRNAFEALLNSEEDMSDKERITETQFGEKYGNDQHCTSEAKMMLGTNK